MSALGAIDAGLDEVTPVDRAGATRRRQAALRLVAPPSRSLPRMPVSQAPPPASPAGGSGTPRSCARPAVGPLPDRLPMPARLPGTGPLRLTRRGRLVVASFAVLLATVVLTVLGVALAGGAAQASNHGRDGAGYQGMHQIVVQPGETLWTIATSAEPSADPRLVISQIMTTNSMTSTAVQAGELLWVPK
jgi:LysM domain